METVDTDYEQTPSVAALAEALALAQDEMENATKDSLNPHFKSKYADLASVREAAKPIYKHGLSVVQQVISRPDAIGLRTVLMHKSGEWMASKMFVAPERQGPQAAGSVITYLRRYMLAAMLGIAQEDDDANAGSMRPTSPPQRQQPSAAPPQVRNGGQQGPKADGAPSSPANGAGAPSTTAPASTSDVITPEQSEELRVLCSRLGLRKVAAAAEMEAVTGKKSATDMTRGDGAKLIAHLKAKVEQTAGVAS